MQSVKGTLIKNEEFYERKKRSIEALLRNPNIVSFLAENHLDESFIEDNWIDFINYEEDLNLCKNCSGIESCQKNFVGYKRVLSYQDNILSSILEICDYGAKVEAEHLVLSHVTTNLPKELFLTSFEDLDLKNNGNLFQLLKELLSHVKEVPQKGLYVYGDMGIGKSYVLSAFCHMLAINHIDCAFISMPQLITDLKSYFNSDEDNGMNDLKQIPYLVLDDLGAETLSVWARDEVLYNLLNERMLRKLPTYFTTVYNLNELESHYLLNKTKDEYVKVKRLIERIKALSKNFEFTGKNFR